MNTGRRKRGRIGILCAIVLLPLVGAAAKGGRPLREFFQFPPPLEIPSAYLRFSWWAVAAALIPLVLFAASWAAGSKPRHGTKSEREADLRGTTETFPLWGWLAVLWIGAWWMLAWNRWHWFQPVQRYTFFPLWLGFIVFVNALTQKRRGTCLMLRNPAEWFRLFALSAVFWWGFEWLNRFVRNWHYLAVENVSALEYAVHATLCFSTVLPAVAAIAEWLMTFRSWRTRTATGPTWRWFESTSARRAMLACGAIALLLTGAFPNECYPALWLAPLLLALGGSGGASEARSLIQEFSIGDWRRGATWMVAALICGLFWELWNWRSLAKWIYTVPGVERWPIFEMPLLGYLGYLPFGLECLLVAGAASAVIRDGGRA